MGLCFTLYGVMQKIRKIAISACLLGEKCRYDATDNKNSVLLEKLKEDTLIPFCPEDFVFGSPRPTMDLIRTATGDKALSNETGEDLSLPVVDYAHTFFNAHPDIDLVIGKDRSPSCGVCSAKLYDEKKVLLSSIEAGLMIKEAKKRNIPCVDAEVYKG